MKYLISLITLTIILSCDLPHNGRSSNEEPACSTAQTRKPIRPETLFTLADAENIMGEKAKLSDSSSSHSGRTTAFNSAYLALETRGSSGRAGNIYFMYEEYAADSAASKSYRSIRDANKPNGIRELDQPGDEAYFHSDNTNFYFILVRKGNRMIRMKVNKITDSTSLEQFHRVAKKIEAEL